MAYGQKHSLSPKMAQNSSKVKENTNLKLFSILETQLQDVNKYILEQVFSSINIIPEISHYIISSGGKRLRPLLALASAELFNYKGNDHINLAACIELIHTATLLHDDVIDESNLRRGKPTANFLWNNKISIIIGDFLLSQAFHLMIQQNNPQILKILSQASLHIVEGEAHQMQASFNIFLDQEQYLKIIQNKTSPLFSAATHAGAVLANASNKHQLMLRDFGLSLGNAFQITDDILDYTSTSQLLGKTPGEDFYEGKVTLPLILAYQKSSPQQKKILEDLMIKPERNLKDFEFVVDYIHQINGFKEARDIANHYCTKALQSIKDLEETPIKEALSELIEFSNSRLA